MNHTDFPRPIILLLVWILASTLVHGQDTAPPADSGVTAEVIQECYDCVLRSRPMMKYRDCKFTFRITNHTKKLLAWDDFAWEYTTRDGKLDSRGLSTTTGNRLGPGKTHTFNLWCQVPEGSWGHWRAWGLKGRVHGSKEYRFDFDWEVRGSCP